jgi:hypothetical protein
LKQVSPFGGPANEFKVEVSPLGHQHALYDPHQLLRTDLLRQLGFVETSEWEDDEVVARLIERPPQQGGSSIGTDGDSAKHKPQGLADGDEYELL